MDKTIFSTILILIASTTGFGETLNNEKLRNGQTYTLPPSGEQTLFLSVPADGKFRIQLEQKTALFLITVFDDENKEVTRLVSTNASKGPIIFRIDGKDEASTFRINVKQVELYQDQDKAIFTIKRLKSIDLNEEEKTKIDWFSQNARQLKEKGEGYDFNAIGEAIGNARVVFLGEMTHQDAEVNIVKIELIKWLNEQKNFHHLAIESDIFAAHVLQNAMNENSHDRLLWVRSFYPDWSLAETFMPLFDYSNAMLNTENKLHIHGFDATFRLRTTVDNFSNDLKAFLDKNKIEVSEAFIAKVTQIILKNGRRGGTPLTEAEKDIFYQEFNQILSKVSHIDDNKYNRFWRQCLKNFYENCQFRNLRPKDTPADTSFRDRLMAENLAWLLKELPENEKVIIWSASAHSARNLHKIQKLYPDSNPMTKTMGQYYMESPTSPYYSIGFTAYQGEFGNHRYNPKGNDPETLMHQIRQDQHESLELEEMFYFAGFDTGFLDFKKNIKNKHWINEPIPGRIFGHEAVFAPWPELFDGIIFLREVTPTKMASWIIEEGKKMQKKKQESEANK